MPVSSLCSIDSRHCPASHHQCHPGTPDCDQDAAKRTVTIEIASDPDIIIREEIRPETYRNIIAIEVKGGRDFSNIHNRIGEAEKSHQKAKGKGYEQ